MTRWPPSPPKRATRRWAILALGRNRASAAIVDQESAPAAWCHAWHQPLLDRGADMAAAADRQRPEGVRAQPRRNFKRRQHTDCARENWPTNTKREQQQLE